MSEYISEIEFFLLNERESIEGEISHYENIVRSPKRETGRDAWDRSGRKRYLYSQVNSGENKKYKVVHAVLAYVGNTW